MYVNNTQLYNLYWCFFYNVYLDCCVLLMFLIDFDLMDWLADLFFWAWLDDYWLSVRIVVYYWLLVYNLYEYHLPQFITVSQKRTSTKSTKVLILRVRVSHDTVSTYQLGNLDIRHLLYGVQINLIINLGKKIITNKPNKPNKSNKPNKPATCIQASKSKKRKSGRTLCDKTSITIPCSCYIVND